MTQIINHCRVLSGWNPYGEAEILNILPTWMDALREVPDNLLKASVDKATADHDWSQPFPVKAVVAGYKAIVLEDRQKRQTAQYSARHMDDTVGCKYCGDVGYVSIATYCPTGNEWQYPAYACQCAATPVNQRRATPISEGWDRDAYGRWIPTSADVSPQCRCAFCLRGGGR